MTEWTTTADRPDPMRLQLESYPVIDAIAARYGDMDANGHLNNWRWSHCTRTPARP